MENLTTSNLLFEMMIRVLHANLKMQSLIIKTSQSQEIQDEGKEILDQLIQWTNTIQNSSGIEKNVKILFQTLANTLESITITADKKHSFEKGFTAVPAEKEEILDASGDNAYINDLIEDSRDQETLKNTTLTEGKLSTTSPNKQAITVPEDVGTTTPIMEKTSRTLGFLDRLSEIGTKIDQPEEEGPLSQESLPRLFQRILKPQDEWGYLEQLNTLLRNYSNIMHLALPNFLFSIVEELHRYRSDNMELMEQIVSVPSTTISNLISKLLKEAPGATLLKRLRASRRIAQIDIDDDINIDEEDRRWIKIFVEQYYETVKQYLDTTKPVPIHSYYDKLSQSLINFSLGPVEIETRIIQVVKVIINDLLTKAKPTPNKGISLTMDIALLATAQIFFDMTDYWIGEGSRIRHFLEEMKDMKL